jgi:hypothetical protein
MRGHTSRLQAASAEDKQKNAKATYEAQTIQNGFNNSGSEG